MPADTLADVSFRDYSSEDYAGLTGLWRAAGLSYKPQGRDRQEAIAAELQRGAGRFILAEAEGQIIGAVLVTHDGRKGWINRLAVLPERQRSGLAKLLVAKAETWVYSLGIDIVTCLIEDSNAGSMDFFHRLGYEKHTDIIYFSKRKNEYI